jgi:hypothetical protein
MAKPKAFPKKRRVSTRGSSDEGESDNKEHGSDNDTQPSADETFGNMGNIMSKILKTSSTDPKAPILAKRRAVERKIQDEKLENRARKLVRRELREARDAAHIVPDMSTANAEKTLRKVATRGVVQLFNAVNTHQVNKEKAEKAVQAAKEAKRAKPTSVKEKTSEDVKALSKASFLELLKMGGARTKKAE